MPLVKNFDKKAILDAVRMDDDFGKYAAESWRKHIEPYVPYRTGRLCNDVTIRPWTITYNAPYASDVYNNVHMNFNKEKHPLATAKWDEVAMPAETDGFVQDLQSYLKTKRFDV